MTVFEPEKTMREILTVSDEEERVWMIEDFVSDINKLCYQYKMMLKYMEDLGIYEDYQDAMKKAGLSYKISNIERMS